MWNSRVIFAALFAVIGALPQKIFDPRHQVMTLQQVLKTVKELEIQHGERKQQDFEVFQETSAVSGDRGRVLTVPIHAISEDLPQLERESLADEKGKEEEFLDYGDVQTWQIMEDGTLERRRGKYSGRSESAEILDIRSADISGLRQAAQVTSTGVASLTLSPGSRLYGQPEETVQVEFLLTNHGPDQYFTISAKESSQTEQTGVQDQVVFPTTGSFLSGLSEDKPWVRRNQTTTLVISLRVPGDAAVGARKMLSLDCLLYTSPSPRD